MKKTKTVICDIVRMGIGGVFSKPPKEYAIVELFGSEVKIELTKSMAKDCYDTNKVKITIEIL